MQAPKNWTEIRLETYLDFISLKRDEYPDDHTFACDCLGILLNAEIEDIEVMKYRRFREIQDEISFVYQTPTKHAEQVGKYHLRPFNEITLGEFIDIEYYIADNDNIPIILAIIFKQRSLNEWNEPVYEPYAYQPTNRAQFFREQSMADVWNAVQDYIRFRNYILEQYKDLFVQDVPEQEEDFEGLSPAEVRKIKKEIEAEEARAKFSWERWIKSLSNGLVDFNKITDLPLILVLNYVSMEKAG